MTAAPGAAHIGLVVEGPGDKGALPVLLRKYLHDQGIYADILGKPVPLKGKGSATTTNGVEGYVLAAARPGCVGVIVLVDADKDASCELGPALLERTVGLQAAPVVIAVAEKDFEDWLHASVETLGIGVGAWDQSKRGKSVIESALSPEKYIKSTMQARLTHRMDVGLARTRNRSLDRMLRKLDEMVSLLPEE